MDATVAQPSADNTSGINSPALTPKGKPTNRAVQTAAQAHGLAESLRNNARNQRLKQAGFILDKYNGGQPFSTEELTKLGQSWRNNFSTGFLGSIVDRVKPQLLDPIKNGDVLTHSVLPAKFENASEKSRIFQKAISSLIRKWTGWEDFTSKIAQENVLNGCVLVSRLDDNWRPTVWGLGESYLPDHTSQHADGVSFAVYEENMLLCDFLKLIADKEVAEHAGFNYEECIKAANRAQGLPDDLNEVQLQEMVREGASLNRTYTHDGSKFVNLYHVVVQDHTGEIDLWTVTRDGGHDIRNRKGLHATAIEAWCLITFQHGSGRYYGSKGLGRLLCNLHVAIDRLRNLGADQAYLAGLLVLVGDAANLDPQILHPFIVLPEGVQLGTQRIEFDAEAYTGIINDLIAIAESVSGAFVPPNIDTEGSTKTKIEAAQKAEREIAVKQGVLGRFSKQFANVITMMQKAIVSSDNLRAAKSAFDNKQRMTSSGQLMIQKDAGELMKKAFGNGLKDEVKIESDDAVGDPEAINCIIEMLESGLQPQEIAILAVTPADSDDIDEGSDSDSKTLAYISNPTVMQSPYIDQQQRADMEASLAIGPTKAKQLLIAQDDPNVEAFATKQQIIEYSEMIAGNMMPVVATENHPIHRKTIYGKSGQIFAAVAQAPTPQLIETCGLVLKHIEDHMAADTKTPDEQKKKEMELIKPWIAALQHGQQMLAATQQQQAQEAAAQQQQANGAPAPTDPKLQIETAKLGLAHRKLDLDQQKQDHEREMGLLGAANEAARTTADVAIKSKEDGRKEAESERQAIAAEQEPSI